jgi:hypothetical protein
VTTNTIEKQILEEGWRNAVVKLTGILATSDANWSPAISLSDFQNNDQIAGPLTGLRVDAVNYSLGPVLDALLSWQSAIPQQIVSLSKSGKIDVTGDGGFLPDKLRSGYNGAINLTTSGFPPGTQQNFTLLLRLIKLY